MRDLAGSVRVRGFAVVVVAMLVGLGGVVSVAGPAGAANRAVSSTVLSVSVASSVAGQMVVLSAAVSSTVPVTGVVVFKRGSVSLGSVPVTAGVAVLSTAKLPVGSWSLTAVYGGSSMVLPSTSAGVGESVAKATTTAVLTVDAPLSVAGELVTLSALVGPVEPGAPVPTGTVVFRNGTTSVGSKPLTGGVATLTTSKLPVGVLSLTATYNGSSKASGSVSSVVVGAVAKASTSVSLIASDVTPVAGESVTVTARVMVGAPSVEVATGSVKFMRATTVVKTVVLAAGVASFTSTTLPAGPLVLSATYVGSGRMAGSSVGSVSPNLAATSIQLFGGSAPFGSPLYMTAYVTPVVGGSGAITGSVTYREGTTVLGSAPSAGNYATLVVSDLSVGTHTIVATYSGDATFAGSVSTATDFTVTVAPLPTVTQTGNNGPVAFGAPLGLGALVTAPGGGLPSGTVTFIEGGVVLGTAPIGVYGAGVAVMQVSNLPVGTHTIVATYSGDGTFAASLSSGVDATVTLGRVTIAAGADVNPSTAGSPVTFTVTVVPTIGTNPAPSGTVTIADPPDVVAADVALVNGTATITTSTLAAGDHDLLVTYSGDANYSPPGASLVGQTVRSATVETLTSNLNPATPGDAVTFSATLNTGGPATGSVEFRDGTTVLDTVPVVGTGAGLIVNNLDIGDHVITAD